jgi:uncharacterized membrane protein
MQIAFSDRNTATIDFESEVPSPVREGAATLLLCLYAARQISNLGSEGESLASVLASIGADPSRLLRLITPVAGEVYLAPAGIKLRRAFWAGLAHPDDLTAIKGQSDIGFSFEVDGFGKKMRGIGYYAPVSVLLLAVYCSMSNLYDSWPLDFGESDGKQMCVLASALTETGVAALTGKISPLDTVEPVLDVVVPLFSKGAEGAVPHVDEGDEPRGEVNPVALAFAQQRYAKGEISRDEFKQIQADLVESD